jgi:uncharacterized protein YmfQ (DUF2313 family)
MSQLNTAWMRKNTVDISKYLPKYLQKDNNFHAITDVTSFEHEKVRQELQDIFEQFFVSTATWGLEMWERVFELTPTSDEIYEYRRNQILLKMRGAGMSTVAAMTKIVNTYGSGYIVEDNAKYNFSIYCSAEAAALVKMKQQIEIYKPAHLGYTVYLGYSWNGNITFDGSHNYDTAVEEGG